MGDLTFDQLVAETRVGLLGRRTDDATADDPRVGLWVNWAYRYISQPSIHRHDEFHQSETQLTVANQVGYIIASVAAGTFYVEEDVALLENPFDPTARTYRLLPLRYREFLEMRNSGAGLPTHYTVRGPTLLLNPFPSTQYAGWTLLVDSWYRPPALTGGQGTLLPANWDPAIIQGAVWHGFRSTGDLARAELAKADLDALVNNQLDTERVRSEDQTEGVVHLEVESYEEGLR